uniref:Uncharacterized protein n=1 Tax=Siphoviridae sp. ct58H1 TaxID=2825334 RepID=A0A8S5P6V2_9CAUD|nr:MAG TPA: hypothetical protein [Siphoviridae sp. ct58H1]
MFSQSNKKGKTNEDEKRNGLHDHRSNRWDDCLFFWRLGSGSCNFNHFHGN